MTENDQVLARGPISGFPEYLPDWQAVFNDVVNVIRKNYAKAGSVEITTPLVERLDVLTAKGGGGIRKEIYGLKRMSGSDDGSTSVLGLKYDLTVPLARYVAQHESDLVFPFRRHQIDRVHRGERPQSGRYREFCQADFDIIGRDSLAITADAEPLAVINDIFSELEIGPFVIRINNRKIFDGYFQHIGLDPKVRRQALTIIDKSENGRETAIERLREETKISGAVAEEIVRFTDLAINVEDPLEALSSLRLNDSLSEGIDEIVHVAQAAIAFGVPMERLKIDLSVARGLDYYTGSVYETALLDHLSLGSICSGGRYDDLTSQFSNGNFPGVGISIGVSRLVARLVKVGVFSTQRAFDQHLLIARLDSSLVDHYLGLAGRLRRAGVPTEVYFEDHGLGRQLKYAARKGFGFAVIVGADEVSRSVVQLRDLNRGDQCEMSEAQLISTLISDH
jgi:histidyl-tRNA synthetase